MRTVSPADLATFLAIARHRSFRRAAAELRCTPSALSHALRALEERLDLRLFNRTTRSVALTEAGQSLFDRVSPAFRDIDDALDDLNNFRGAPAGSLRINAPRALTEMVLLPIMARFLDANPRVQVEIVVEEALIDMVSQGFDAGIRFGETIAQDMVAVPIGPSQRSAIVASPDFLARHKRPTRLEQLRDLPCIRFRFSTGRDYGWEFEKDGKELVIQVDGPIALGDGGLIVDAALAGIGIAYCLEGQVVDHIAAGRLVRLLEDWCPPYGGFYLYYPSRRQLPAPLRAFVDFIKAERDQAPP